MRVEGVGVLEVAGDGPERELEHRGDENAGAASRPSALPAKAAVRAQRTESTQAMTQRKARSTGR